MCHIRGCVRTDAWTFVPVRGLEGDRDRSKGDRERFEDVQELVSEHLGLSETEEPELSFAEGVLSGEGKLRESVRDIVVGILVGVVCTYFERACSDGSKRYVAMPVHQNALLCLN